MTAEAPFAQSSTTVNFRFEMAAESTASTIPSTYRAAPPRSGIETPIRSKPAGAGVEAAKAVSMDSSTGRLTSRPSAAMHLNPLNSGGLCEAVTMTPTWAPIRGTLYWIAGVGRMPSGTIR